MPVKSAPLPEAVKPPQKPKAPEANKPLFIDDNNPDRQYKYLSGRATLSISRGRLKAALRLLRAAQRFKNTAPLHCERGEVYVLMVAKQRRPKAEARKLLRLARGSFQQCLRKNPTAKYRQKARNGQRDVVRLTRSYR